MSFRIIGFLSAVVLVSGCGDSDSAPPDDDAGRRRPDAGPPVVLESLTYEPEGCGYDVVTPEVREAVEGGDALGDSPAPLFVHVSFAGPPESSFAVNWRTDVDTTATRILVGTDRDAVSGADDADEAAGVLARSGHHVLFEPLVGDPIRLHEAHVCGLSPDTTYFYKVGYPGAWSDVYDVATAPPAGSNAAFRFAVTGDSRNDSVIWAEVQSKVAEHAPEMQLFSGDAVVFGPNQPEWDGFFGEAFMGQSVQEVLARIPIMPANGNHEGLAVNYTLQFALPQEITESERAEGEEWYSFDYGNAHFVVLNDTAGDALVEGPQADWLEANLSAVDRAATPWVFVMHHKAMYSCGNHGSDYGLRRAWQAILDRHEVDIVFNGHDHHYERSLPIRGFTDGTTDGAVRAWGAGTLYIVSGGAGAPLYSVDSDCYHSELTESVNNYAIVDIEDRSLRYVAYRLDGSELDRLEITK